MSYKLQQRSPRRNAVAAVKVAVALPVLLGCVALAVDMGVVYNTRAELQRTADAAALAAISEVAYANAVVDPRPAATLVAADYVDRNDVFGNTMTINPSTDVVFGHAYYDVAANRYNFVAGDVPTNSVRVTVRQTSASANGPTHLFFASVLGTGSVDVSASAVAIFVGTNYEQADCYDDVPPGSAMLCHMAGDSDDSDDSEVDGDDSDDSQAERSNGTGTEDSESAESPNDSDSPHTILIDATATPLFLRDGDTLGSCACTPGDSDDSDDSMFGDSSDSDDSHPGGTDNPGGTPGPSPGGNGSGFDDDDDDDDVDVTLCHYPPGIPNGAYTLTVDSSDVSAHLAHNDTIGLCAQDVRVFLIE